MPTGDENLVGGCKCEQDGGSCSQDGYSSDHGQAAEVAQIKEPCGDNVLEPHHHTQTWSGNCGWNMADDGKLGLGLDPDNIIAPTCLEKGKE